MSAPGLQWSDRRSENRSDSAVELTNSLYELTGIFVRRTDKSPFTHEGTSSSLDIDTFARERGIDFKNHPRGGVTGIEPKVATNVCEVTLLQRKATPSGHSLGKTTDWTDRLTLQRRGVKAVSGVKYVRIDDAGLHCVIGGKPEVLAVDTVIISSSQEPARGLYDALAVASVKADLIGDAFESAELDASARWSRRLS